jgi:preflagellin peptidase FlaK
MILIPFFYLTIIISIIGLIIATYTDLKERIVPNKLNYGLAIIGLLLYAAQSLIETTLTPIMYSIIGLCFGFFFGWVLWKLGVFAGGDVKLLMALGALNPFTPAIINTQSLTAINAPIFPISLFTYSLIAFLPYGLFVLAYKIMKNKEFQKKLAEEMKPKIIEATHASIFTAGMLAAIILFNANTLIIIPALAIWELFKENKKYLTIFTALTAIMINYTLYAQILAGAIIISVILYTTLKIMLSTRKLLSTKIKVKELKEGMIPATSLAWKGKKIIQIQGISIKQIIKYVKEQNTWALKEMLVQKKEIISATKARGLNKKELKAVKMLAEKGLIPKTIRIKESMPFVPTMLLGYALCLLAGDAVPAIIIGIL